MRLKRGDTVQVITGRDKGEIGEIIEALPKTNQVIVEGVNLRKKHELPSQLNPDGGIIEQEMPIDASNVMIYDKKSKSVSRIGFKFEDGKKIRVYKTTGKEIK